MKTDQTYFKITLIVRTKRSCNTQRRYFFILLVPDFLGELRIGYQETGDLMVVEAANEVVDFRIHDWFTNQGQGAVLDC